MSIPPITRLKKSKVEYYWRKIFEFGVFIKGLNGVWETIAGLSILIIGKARFGSLFSFLVRGELLENPHDWFINAAVQALQNFGGAKTFIGLYFLIHGVINIFLSIQLYRDRLWAYLATIGVTIIFIVYQLHRISLYHSRLLMAVTGYDVLFIILTWHEYQYQKKLRS